MLARVSLISFLLAAMSLAAQQTAPASTATAIPRAPAVELNGAEKQCKESTSNVSLRGFLTVGDESQPKEDGYTIGKITKIGEDLWSFDASIEHNGRAFKAVVKVPVKWAGDTPVLTLSNYLIKGH